MKPFALAALLVAGATLPASAALFDVTGPLGSAGAPASIIAAPSSVADHPPGAENTAMQGFDELQGFTHVDALAVDGGSIGAGARISSHMIFLNTAGGALTTHGFNQPGPVVWSFDGDILGVVSVSRGVLLAGSDFLGAPGATYPGAFGARGLEGDPLSGFGDDCYFFSGSTLSVGMRVTRPGDWMRVITEAPAPAPLPAAGWLLIAGLGGLAAVSRRRKS